MPKLIDKTKDYYSDIETLIYEYPNGVRLVLSLNPKTVEFNMSVIHMAGAYYERQIGVPDGTSHLLEHILCSAPNSTFRTRRQMQEYTFGNKSRPWFNANAKVNKFFNVYYADGHEQARERIIKLLSARMDCPNSNLAHTLEEERKIVISELKEKDKEERDEWLNFDKFMFGETHPWYHTRVIGNENSVKEVSLQDLVNFRDATFTAKNTVIAIQANKKLDKSANQQLENLASLYPESKGELYLDRTLYTPVYKYSSFFMPDRQGVAVSLNYIYKAQVTIRTDEEYLTDRMRFLTTNLIREVLNEKLREEMNLVYGVRAHSYGALVGHVNRGFDIQCSIENLQIVLGKICDYLYSGEWSKYLDTPSGRKWFADQISSYIYHRNVEFSEQHADKIGYDLLMGDELHFDYRKARKTMMGITIEQLKSFVSEFLKIPMALWVVSPQEQSEIDAIVKNSDLGKLTNA